MALAALPYEEPDIVTILIQVSFLLVLNAINWVLDNIIYCGLVGQILIGVAWGAPGANWLSEEVQDAVMQLGYLGLILIVYEGGLPTSFAALWSNLYLSGLVALIGISTPIGLSFVLLKLLEATPVQAFAADAALCSTSLGTTFTILSTSGLDRSRLGVILSSAAMLDDVAGLVMVQVISNLGTSTGSFGAVTVIRPVFVSVAFALVVPAICRFLVQPLTGYVLAKDTKGTGTETSKLVRWICTPAAAFVAHTLVLIALVAGSSYAGTSNLFAAYIAGAVVTWWDALVDKILEERNPDSSKEEPITPAVLRVNENSAIVETRSSSALGEISTDDSTTRPRETPSARTRHELTGMAIYERLYNPAVTRILKPFFFASIGFSIPITQMFTGAIFWRGMVYTILMIIGKACCGLVLIRFNPCTKIQLPAKTSRTQKQRSENAHCSGGGGGGSNSSSPEHTSKSPQNANTSRKLSNPQPHHQQTSRLPKPQSLYPAAMLGSAMVARGEIGFLISSLAESKGVFSGGGGAEEGKSSSSDIFLVVTWEILLCTVLGPVGVGGMVRRVRGLRGEEGGKQTGRDPLGGWGVEM